MSTENDIWLEVSSANGPINAKYFGLATTVFMPYGPNGPAEARTKFNLSAYVRDEIAAALDRFNQINANQAASQITPASGN